MNTDGSEQTRLTKNNANDDDPIWSQDGKHIIFISDRDGNYEIYEMNNDGSEQINITKNLAIDVKPVLKP